MLTDFAALGAELARISNHAGSAGSPRSAPRRWRSPGCPTTRGSATRWRSGSAAAAALGGEIVGISEALARAMTYAPLDGAAVGDAATLLGPAGVHPGRELGRAHRRCLRPAARRPAARARARPAPRCAGRRRRRRRARGWAPGSPPGSRSSTRVLPIARGQRIGVFAGSGIGKSTLLADLARGIEADIVVYALIGERGRELRDFVDNVLGPEGMAARGGGRRHLRPGAAHQAPRRLDGDGHGRGVPRPGPARAPADRLADPLRRGAPRDRADRRRGAVLARLPAVDGEPDRRALRAGRAGAVRQGRHHRDLQRAGRGLGHGRADRRHHPRRARRPCGARPRHRRARPLPGDRRAPQRVAQPAGDRDRGGERACSPGCGGC